MPALALPLPAGLLFSLTLWITTGGFITYFK